MVIVVVMMIHHKRMICLLSRGFGIDTCVMFALNRQDLGKQYLEMRTEAWCKQLLLRISPAGLPQLAFLPRMVR